MLSDTVFEFKGFVMVLQREKKRKEKRREGKRRGEGRRKGEEGRESVQLC